jgi:hypothetical protein
MIYHSKGIMNGMASRDLASPSRVLGVALTIAFHEALSGLSSTSRITRRNMKIRERQQRKKKRKTVGDAMAPPGQIVQACFGSAWSHGCQTNIENVNLLGRQNLPMLLARTSLHKKHLWIPGQ